jgi:hypothetical protein
MPGNFFGGQVFGGGFFGATTRRVDHGGRVRIQRERERLAEEELLNIIRSMAPTLFDHFDE